MKVDMHIHSIYSGDSICKLEGIIKAAKRRGLDCVAITDHNTTKAWRNVSREGRKGGIAVILGEEVEVTHNGRVVGEILGYFMSDEVKSGGVYDVLDALKSQGALIAIPHPFCFQRGIRMNVEEIINHIDAVEVFNSGMYFNYQNRQALRLARKHRLAEIGGSDAHTELEIGNAYTYAKADEVKGFRNAIIKRKTRAEGRLSNQILRVLSKFFGTGI